MYAIAFDGYGQVAQVCVPKGERVTGEFLALKLSVLLRNTTWSAGHKVEQRELSFYKIMHPVIKSKELSSIRMDWDENT